MKSEEKNLKKQKKSINPTKKDATVQEPRHANVG